MLSLLKAKSKTGEVQLLFQVGENDCYLIYLISRGLFNVNFVPKIAKLVKIDFHLVVWF